MVEKAESHQTTTVNVTFRAVLLGLLVDSGQHLFYHGKPSEVLEHIADHNGAYLQRGDHLNSVDRLQSPPQAFPTTFCPQTARVFDSFCDAVDFLSDLRA